MYHIITSITHLTEIVTCGNADEYSIKYSIENSITYNVLNNEYV